MTARECLGRQPLPVRTSQCFSERARRIAAEADVIVTNHALLAIDTLGDGGILPEHRVVIVDEAHELVDRVHVGGQRRAVGVRGRVRGAADREAGRATRRSPGCPRRATRSARCSSPCPRAGWTGSIPALGASLAALRDAAHACAGEVRKPRSKDDGADPGEVSAAQTALVALEEMTATADRMITAFEQPIEEREEVVWLERPAGLIADILAPRVAARGAARGRRGAGRVTVRDQDRGPHLGDAHAGRLVRAARQPVGARRDSMGSEWAGIDVGSPFAHGRSGILYVAQAPAAAGAGRPAAASTWTSCGS